MEVSNAKGSKANLLSLYRIIFIQCCINAQVTVVLIDGVS